MFGRHHATQSPETASARERFLDRAAALGDVTPAAVSLLMTVTRRTGFKVGSGAPA